MKKVLMCRDLGLDCACRYEARGESTSDVMEQIMKHVRSDHELDWFEIEEIYVTALARVHERVA